MKLHRSIASLTALLLAVIASPPAGALDVYITTYDSGGVQTSFTPLSSGTSSTVNLDLDSGAPKGYGPFLIGRCSTCTARPRIYVLEGSIDKLVLTDAQILNRNTASTSFARMVISVDSGALGVSGPAGDYPYAVELNGSFLGSTPTDPLNRIQVIARTTAITSCSEGCFGNRTMIDSPATDAGETDATASTYSVVAPPFSGGFGVFGPKEQQNSTCSGWFVPDPNNPEGGVDSCRPALNLNIDISLKGGHSAKLPGSIGAFHVTSRCEADSTDPKLQRGCNIMANFFASLGPKGFKVYDVRLEPSPGGPDITVRGMPSNADAWVTRRGASDDDDGGGNEGNISNTRVRLQSNGVGDVRANGLCRAAGCDSSNDLPVHVYCGDQPLSDALLHLNSKGDGKADLIFSLPCKDPAVLILDPSGQFWVAAPAIL